MVASRSVGSCPHRTRVRQEEGFEVADCGLVAQIIGALDFVPPSVRREACDACAATSLPTVTEINTVTASVLYRAAAKIEERGGVTGCDASKASRLRNWAADSFRSVFSHGPGLTPARNALGLCDHLDTQVGSRLQAVSSGSVRVPVFGCQHPNRVETTPDECSRCRDWTDRTRPAPRRVESILPLRSERQGPRVEHWAVGVLTSARCGSRLARCLDSLELAGWEQPRLFIDSTALVPDRFARLPVSRCEPGLGPWGRFHHALRDLLVREPEADAYLLVNEEAVFDDRLNQRALLERILWPGDPIGAVTLDGPGLESGLEAGWQVHDLPANGRALAVVFPRESACWLAADCRDSADDSARVESVIGAWAASRRLPVLYPTPRLVGEGGELIARIPLILGPGADRRSPDQRLRKASSPSTPIFQI